jgi:hypothetical protein
VLGGEKWSDNSESEHCYYTEQCALYALLSDELNIDKDWRVISSLYCHVHTGIEGYLRL